MADINKEIESMIAEMREIGQLPATCRGGNRNNLIRYQDLKCKILERFLSAFESGYRLSVPESQMDTSKIINREEVKRRLRIWIAECEQELNHNAADNFRDCIDLVDSIPGYPPTTK